MSGLPIRIRFEQRRGHYLVVEGTEDRPLTLADCDAFQLRMLAANEVPGLLGLTHEQVDGRLTLRYALSGSRMLSHELRVQKWTMAAFMGAVNRMAEVMEDCRLYVLEPENLLLETDRIFVGERGETDVRFIYLPLPSAHGSLAQKLESLLVRWMMHTENLDGTAVQRMLQLIASPDFKPAALARFARRYLAEQLAGTGNDGLAAASSSSAEIAGSVRSAEAEAHDASDVLPHGSDSQPPAAGWRWFEPPAADAQGVSALLGNGSEEAFGEAPEGLEPEDAGRRRNVWLACAAVALVAVVWRWGYIANPGTVGLGVSIAATVAVLAVGCGLWWAGNRGRTAQHGHGFARKRPASADASARGDVAIIPPYPESAIIPPHRKSAIVSTHGEAVGLSSMSSHPRNGNNDGKMPIFAEMHTGQFAAETERTQQLDQRAPLFHHAQLCLLWESAPQTPLVPLHSPSMVIGRSREASGHIDESPGISRAHLELRQTGAGWVATDLGSRNGTRLNGEPMVAYEPYPLQPEDCLDLAAGSRYRLIHDKGQRLMSANSPLQ